MEKIEEVGLIGGVLKLYNSGKNLKVLDVINQLKENGCSISTIKVLENVERDMQTVDGTELNESDFREQYNYLSTHMLEGSFRIECELNGMEFRVIVYDGVPKIGLSTTDPNFEIDDIFNKKKIALMD